MARFNGTNSNDFLTGTAGDDRIVGLVGDDRLYGEGGADTILGGEGSDLLYGGPGNDLLVPGSNEWVDFVLPGSGNDTIDFSQTTPNSGYNTVDFSDGGQGDFSGGVQSIVATIDARSNTATVDQGTGGLNTIIDVNNALAYNGSGGGLRLVGTGLIDVFNLNLQDNQQMELRLLGVTGSQLNLNSAEALFSLSYTRSDIGVRAELDMSRTDDATRYVTSDFGSSALYDYIDGVGDVYRFRGSNYDDVVYGSDATRFIYTYGGNDRIVARSTQEGWSTFNAGIGEDTVDLRGLTAGTSFYNLYTGASLSGITATIDSEARSNVLDLGIDGQTTVLGIGQALQYDGPLAPARRDLVASLLPEEAGGLRLYGSRQDDHLTISVHDGEWFQFRDQGGSDTIQINENEGYFVLEYRDSDYAISANLARGVIHQQNGAGTNVNTDRISGQGEVNQLRATDHDDQISGSNANEIFMLGAGNDTLNGKGGFDIVNYSYGLLYSDLAVDLARGRATATFDGQSTTDRLRNIEGATGGNGDDTFIGNRAANTFMGFDGDDTLDGGSGNDILAGGLGDDVLIGGGGADRFVFVSNGGADTVTDFNANSNREDIDLSDVTRIRNFRDLSRNHMEQDGDDVLIADGRGTTILLQDVDINDLNKGDFLF